MPVSERTTPNLFQKLANDPAQPFDVGLWCGPRSNLMIGRMLQNSIDPNDIGQAMLWAPPAFLFPEKIGRPLMSASGKTNFSFRNLGSDVVANGYRFAARPYGLEITQADGSSIKEPTNSEPRNISYKLNDDGSCHEWGAHIAPTLMIKKEDGSVYRAVIDPFLADRPISEQAWKEKQNCPTAILMHADQTGMLKIVPDENSLPTICAVAETKAIKDPLGEDQTETVVTITGFEGRQRGRIINPYAQGMIKDEAGAPSLDRTVKYFEEWLAPIRAFQNWKQSQSFSMESRVQNDIPSPPSRPIYQP